MGRVPYSEFVGSRARFQRLSDQHVSSGWLRELRHDTAALTISDPLELQAGERYLFQIQGVSADAYFIGEVGELLDRARITRVEGALAAQLAELPAQVVNFRVLTQIQLRDVQQLPRKAVEAITAKISAHGKSVEALVSDASAGGMGVLVWEELQRGDVIEVKVSSHDLNATFFCEVRHCRPEPRLIGAYRVGLQFNNPDRIALTSWRKLINPI